MRFLTPIQKQIEDYVTNELGCYTPNNPKSLKNQEIEMQLVLGAMDLQQEKIGLYEYTNFAFMAGATEAVYDNLGMSLDKITNFNELKRGIEFSQHFLLLKKISN